MKKALVLLSSCTFYFSSFSQEPADALRYSWNVQGGTARTQAIGGAMGSLGGDITSTFVNPAGLAFYKTGDFVLTPLYTFQNTKGTYYGQTEAEKTNRLMLGTSGFVKGNSVNGKSIRSAAFSIAVNRSADFNGDILYRGENNQSSFSQQYVEELNNSGIRDSRAETDFPFGSSLAYNTYWIDATKNSAGQIENYYSNAPVATGLLQQRSVKNRGGVTELALGFAANSNDKLFFGGTIGVPFLNYHRETEFLEADATESTSNNFNYGLFKDDLRTSGIGLNLKAGLIYKPAEFWRLGLAVHSPTLYSLTENYSAQITTDNDQDTWTDESISYMDNQSSEFKYMLVTPYKVIGSVSYVLREIEDVTKQRGFITADVEFVNYKASSFLPDPDSYNREDDEEYLKSLNSAIDKAYKSAVNFRLGGELKFNVLMVRLGAAYYSNPYKDIHGEKGDKLNLSGGLGYRNKGFFADLTYVHAMNKDVNFAYRLENGLYTGANIRNTAGNVVATLGIKF